MWQGQQYYEQSDVMDFTFQCRLNVAKRHLRKFSGVYAHPAQQTSHAQTNNDMPTTSDPPQAPGSILPYPVDDAKPGTFNYQCEYGANRLLPASLSNTALDKDERLSFEMANGMSQVIQPGNGHNMNVNSNDGYNFSDFSGFNSPSLDNSGNGNAYMNFQQINSSPNDFNKSCFGPPTFSQMLENSAHCQVSNEHANSCRRQSPSCPSNPTNQLHIGNTFGNTVISVESNLNGSRSKQSRDSELCDELSEETKIALRERDILRRIFSFRTINNDAANDIEDCYHSQTTIIDRERQNIIRQMQYDEASRDYIHLYFNRKLLALFEKVEQELSTLEASVSCDRKMHEETSKRSRLLPKQAVKLMETWYQENLHNPYPSKEATLTMASEGGITVEQIRKWFANKRNRSRNNILKTSATESEMSD